MTDSQFSDVVLCPVYVLFLESNAINQDCQPIKSLPYTLYRFFQKSLITHARMRVLGEYRGDKSIKDASPL